MIDRLRKLLNEPIEGPYPLPPQEDEQTWRQRALDGLRELSDSGAFERHDSTDDSLGRALESLVDAEIAEFLLAAAGRPRLAGELIRNLADPGRINQGLKGTCAVTCVESYLAEVFPAEYARIIVGLMVGIGEVVLWNGEVLLRDEQLLRWSKNEARRSPVSRLFQVSAMEFAYADLDYRNTWDGYVDPNRESVPPPGERLTRPSRMESTGIDLDAFDRFLEGVTGERWDTLSEKEGHIAVLLQKLGLDTSAAPNFKRDGLGIIIRSATAGEPTFVTLDVFKYGVPEHLTEAAGGVAALPHKVRVLEVDSEKGRIIYEDPLDPDKPWLPGIDTRIEDLKGRCSMNLDDFESLMLELSYKPAFWVPKSES